MDKLKSVHVTVLQVPADLYFECPNCDSEVEINYDDYTDKHGSYPGEWYTITCTECKSDFNIEDVEW